MPVHHKSIYAPPTDDNGLRVLVTRYWPCGVRKDRIDDYVPALAPSLPLLRAYRNADIDWPEYRARYYVELPAPEAQTAATAACSAT